MGPIEHSATRPKLSSAAWRSVRMAAHADAERHDERNGHRAGGDAARVERDREKIARHEKRQHEHNQIKQDQQIRQRDAEQHAQQRDDQKCAHAARDRQNQDHIRDGRHLFGEHLQVRLRDRDDKAEQEGQEHDHAEPFTLGHAAAHALAHRAHGHFCAPREEHHADDEQHRAHQEAQQDARGDRRDAEAEHQHNADDRQHGV